MAAAAAVSWDIPEQQVFVEFDDPGHSWHLRVLLLPYGAPGIWLSCSSDYLVEVINLGDFAVVPVARNSPLPARVLGDYYLSGPLNPAALEQARAESRALAAVLGVPAAVGVGAPDADWLFADTAHEKFGKPVDAHLLAAPGALLSRGAVGLIEVPGDGWAMVENVRRADAIAWREEKSSGPGRDFRVLALQRDAQRARFRTVREILGLLTPLSSLSPTDWPFRGPSATLELLTSIRAVSDDIVQFHEHFLRSTGLAAGHAVAIKHREMLSVLMHMVSFDQLDVTQLGAAEISFRSTKRCAETRRPQISLGCRS